MCCTCDKNILTAEVTTSGGILQLPTSANDRIKQSRLTSVWVPRSGTTTLKSPLGATVAADTVLATAYLSLKDVNGKEVIQLPFWQIMRDYNAPAPLKLCLDNVDLTQSTIRLDTTATGYNAAHAIVIVFGYDGVQAC